MKNKNFLLGLTLVFSSTAALNAAPVTTGTFLVSATVADTVQILCNGAQCNNAAAAFSSVSPTALIAGTVTPATLAATVTTDSAVDTVGFKVSPATGTTFQMGTTPASGNTLPMGSTSYIVSYKDCAGTSHPVTAGSTVTINNVGSSTISGSTPCTTSVGGANQGQFTFSFPTLTAAQVPPAGSYSQTLNITVCANGAGC